MSSANPTVEELLSGLRSAYEASEARFRAVIEHSADITAIVDAEGRLTYVSPSLERILGYRPDDVVGKVPTPLVHPEDVGVYDAPLEFRVFRALHSDGTWRRLQASGTDLLDDPAVRGVVWTIRDVTDQYELERRVRQSERLEAIGQLAGGIAHDFNNVLLVIRGYTSLLRASLEDPALVSDVDEIAAASERAAELTRQLLAFSRRQVMQPSVVDLGSVVNGIETLLRRSLTEDIEMELEIMDDLPPVLADPGQIEQVLLNLVINARDAMVDGGSVRVTVSSAVLSGESNSSPPLPDGPYVALSVSDTGTGIPAAALPHIFEPFFTTKSDGLGTGLGLSTVYGIVAQSGGGIEVASLPTGGTRMSVFLPAASGEVEEITAESVVMRLPAGTETVLVVEDEDPVRELVSRVLEDVGYQVLPAARPSEAQRIVAESPIDLLLTDIVMPEMSGYDLATRVRLAQPGVRTLYMSGYAHKALGEAAELPDGELLRKPFSPEQLTRAVRAVLDGDVLPELS